MYYSPVTLASLVFLVYAKHLSTLRPLLLLIYFQQLKYGMVYSRQLIFE